jgi:fructoselysine 6-kinase
MVRVIGVGDNTVDKYMHMGRMFPGGNAVNVAVLAHRDGHPASYIGWLGNDVYGDLLRQALNKEGIDMSHCRVVDRVNSHCEVNLVDGERVFSKSTHSATTMLALNDDDLGFVRQHDLVHTSIYSYIERDLQRLSDATSTLSFDFSASWSRDYLAQNLPFVDVAILSYPEQTRAAAEQLMRWVFQQGPQLVLLTQGEDGALVFDGQRVCHQNIIETEAVDTLGAGDAYAARFLVDYLGGTSINQAMANAAEAAATTCGYYGAFGHGIPIP